MNEKHPALDGPARSKPARRFLTISVRGSHPKNSIRAPTRTLFAPYALGGRAVPQQPNQGSLRLVADEKNSPAHGVTAVKRGDLHLLNIAGGLEACSSKDRQLASWRIPAL